MLVRLLDSVIPAWSAGIQADMDVSGRILQTWMPAIHAGVTNSPFSCSVGVRKIMNHVVVLRLSSNGVSLIIECLKSLRKTRQLLDNIISKEERVQ